MVVSLLTSTAQVAGSFGTSGSGGGSGFFTATGSTLVSSMASPSFLFGLHSVSVTIPSARLRRPAAWIETDKNNGMNDYLSLVIDLNE